MNQQGSQFNTGFSHNPSGPYESFKQNVQDWVRKCSSYQSGIFALENADVSTKKKNITSAFSLVGESTLLLQQGNSLIEWVRKAEDAEKAFQRTIWAKPHETRGKMKLEEADALLAKVKIKLSSCFFSSDVSWVSEEAEKTLKALGIDIKSLENAILEVDRLRTAIQSWKLSKQKLTPTFGVSANASELSNSITQNIAQVNRNVATLLNVLKKDSDKSVDSLTEVSAPRDFFIRSMSPAERSHPYGKNVYRLKYGKAEFEICAKGVIFDRDELAIVIGDDDPDRRMFKDHLRRKFPSKFTAGCNPYIENFNHLSKQIIEREQKIRKLMDEIKGEIPHLDPGKGHDNAENSLRKVMNSYSAISRIKNEKFNFLEGPEDTSGYGPLGGNSGGFTPSANPGGNIPTGFPSSSGGSSTSSAASSPANPPASNPSTVINFKGSASDGKTRPPMGSGS